MQACGEILRSNRDNADSLTPIALRMRDGGEYPGGIEEPDLSGYDGSSPARTTEGEER